MGRAKGSTNKIGKTGKAEVYQTDKTHGIQQFSGDNTNYDRELERAYYMSQMKDDDDKVLFPESDYINQVKDFTKKLASLKKTADGDTAHSKPEYWKWQSMVNKFGTNNPVNIATHLVQAKEK